MWVVSVSVSASCRGIAKRGASPPACATAPAVYPECCIQHGERNYVLTDGKEFTGGQVFYVAVAGVLDREVQGAGIVALHIPLERAVPGELRSWSCARAGAAFEEGSERGGGGGRVRRRSGMGRLYSLYVGGCGANKPPLAQGVQREGPSARWRNARRLSLANLWQKRISKFRVSQLVSLLHHRDAYEEEEGGEA